MVIPTINKQQQQQIDQVEEYKEEDELVEESKQVPEELKMTQDQIQMAEPWIAIFGEEPVKKLFGKKWVTKEEGLGECEQFILSQECDLSKESFKAACQIASRAISDKIFQITWKGLSLLESTLTTHSDLTFEGGTSFVSRTLFQDLFHRIGDHNMRLRDRITQILVTMSEQKLVGPTPVLQNSTKLNMEKSGTSHKHAVGRM